MGDLLCMMEWIPFKSFWTLFWILVTLEMKIMYKYDQKGNAQLLLKFNFQKESTDSVNALDCQSRGPLYKTTGLA